MIYEPFRTQRGTRQDLAAKRYWELIRELGK